MSASPFRVALLAAIVLALSPSSSKAQRAPGAPGDLFTDNYNLQLGEPFDLDLDNIPARSRAGYFFRYDKVFWSVSGEQVELGVPGGTQTAETIFPVTAISEGTPPPPFEIPNGIQDAAPNAEFGYGERYEFGYTDGKVGVLVGILDGPSVVSDETYGFGEGFPLGSFLTDNPGTDPFFEDADVDGDGNGIGDGDGPTGGDINAFGFGSVPVTFAAPEGFFLGFRDFLLNLAGATSGTNTGPIFSPLNRGGLIDDIDLDGTDIDVIFITDDLDADGIPGALAVIDPVSGLPVVITDFDDLFEFNVFFDLVNVRNVTETQGIELMRTFNLDNRNQFRRRQNDHLELSYGVRFLRIRDAFTFTGLGSILGLTTTTTQTDNQLIGPQVALKYSKQRGRWNFGAQGRAFAAYNIADVAQTNLFGGELVPGGVNRLLFGRPTATRFGEQKEEISPLIEFRLDSRYQMTSALSLNLGYTATFIDNFHRSALATEFVAPTFGIGDGKSDILIHGLTFGLEGRF